MNADDKTKLRNYRNRRARRVVVRINDIEPQSKKMPAPEQDRFQAEVLKQMQAAGKEAFKHKIALSIDLATTTKSPPHAHTIAKNLLDLLGKRRASVPGTVNDLLYADDSQVQALSVSCRHGEDEPLIRIEARSLPSMLSDLDLATEVTRKIEMDDMSIAYRRDEDRQTIDDFRELIRDEVKQREWLGNETYDAMLSMTRWSAQQALLSISGVDLPVLGWMYGLPKGPIKPVPRGTWAELLQRSAVRLEVGELPTAKGSSEAFKMRIDTEIEKFKERWGKLIEPLVVPVALEVVVRPSRATPPGVLHDLDNIVRSYLIPRVVPAFGTVSDIRWTLDFDDLEEQESELAKRLRPVSMPPAGTKKGVTRYEVWRLPPDRKGAPGFVSVALVADMKATGSLIDQCDDCLDEWAGRLDEEARRERWSW